MNETIRESLTRRVRWCMAIGIGGWVAIAFSTAVGGGGSGFENPIFIVGFITFMGAMLALQWMIKCPRCSVRLGQLAFTLGIPGLKPKPNFCPYCGVSLDETRARRTSAGQPPPHSPIDPIS